MVSIFFVYINTHVNRIGFLFTLFPLFLIYNTLYQASWSVKKNKFMNLYPLSYSSLNQLFVKSTSDLSWMQQAMSLNTTNSSKKRKFNQDQETYNAIDKFQDDLDHLFYEWNSIHIVLESIRNAFTVNQNSSEEYLDQVDKELSIAYDDLMAQVRHLDRRLNKMALEVNQKLLLKQPPPVRTLPPPTPTPSHNHN